MSEQPVDPRDEERKAAEVPAATEEELTETADDARQQPQEADTQPDIPTVEEASTEAPEEPEKPE